MRAVAAAASSPLLPRFPPHPPSISSALLTHASSAACAYAPLRWPAGPTDTSTFRVHALGGARATTPRPTLCPIPLLPLLDRTPATLLLLPAAVPSAAPPHRGVLPLFASPLASTSSGTTSTRQPAIVLNLSTSLQLGSYPQVFHTPPRLLPVPSTDPKSMDGSTSYSTRSAATRAGAATASQLHSG